ncbi:MAG: PKD domain-containing protein [Deltaproteobacteria bacterium]|nr:PKD domain-containing protein [Deltaproteobacteria bacterium]
MPHTSHPPRPRAGGFVSWALLCCLSLVALACSPSETPRPVAIATAVPAAVAAATAGAPAPSATAAGAEAAADSAAATDLNDFSDTADFEWNFDEEASDTEFEIDAAATAFYMPRGNIVTFKAKALNGTPPFSFTWDFGDGSPPGSGEMIKHRFEKLGNIEVTVRAKDASGATAFMQLGLLVHHPVDYAYRMQQDEKTIEELKKRYPDWVPASPAPAVTP